MNNNIKENFINMTIPPLTLPPVPNVNNVNVDICNQTAGLINNNIVPPLNTATRNVITGINTASTNMRTAIITSMGGIDTAVSTSTNGINTCIDAINDSSAAINKVVTFFEKIFNVNTFFDFVKTVVTFILLMVIPDDQIPNVTFWASFSIYLLIFIFIISPIISLIFLF